MLKNSYRRAGLRATRQGGSGALSHSAGPPGRRRDASLEFVAREEPWFLPRHFWRLVTGRRIWHVLAILATVFGAEAAIADNPGALIENRATLFYENPPGIQQTVDSNTVETTVAVVRSPASIALTRVLPASGQFQESVGPSACFDGSAFVGLPDPVLIGGTQIDPTAPQQVSSTASYNQGEPVFIRLDDQDQNVDFQVVDYAEVNVSNAETGDVERLRLTETGPNTGIFTGFIPTVGGPAQAGDCTLQVAAKSSISVNYQDPVDSTDSTSDARPVDPTQRVFETRTGALVTGATIELVDADTGLPATVLGNDGISQFPSAITSGGSVTDSGGTLYVFAEGEYRFPLVPDGNYRLVVTPPPAYAAPSLVPAEELQNLPGAPYDL